MNSMITEDERRFLHIPVIDNSPDQIKLRKSQNTLVIVGTGIIVFGFWTVLKTLGELFVNRSANVAEIRKLAETPMTEISDNKIFWLTIFFTVCYLSFGIVTRLIIGISAIAEGRDRRHGILYFPLTVLMIFLGISETNNSIYMYINTIKDPYAEAGSTDFHMASIIIQLTSVIMMIQMIVAAIRVKKYRRKERLKKPEN